MFMLPNLDLGFLFFNFYLALQVEGFLLPLVFFGYFGSSSWIAIDN